MQQNNIQEILNDLMHLTDHIKYSLPNSPLEKTIFKEPPQKENKTLTTTDEIILDILIRTEDVKAAIKTEEEKETKDKDIEDFSIQYSETESDRELILRYNGQIQTFYQPKQNPDSAPYSINISYKKSEYIQEWKIQAQDYSTQRNERLQDFSNRVDKTLHLLPKSIMGGVLGYTFLGENFMARRDDLIGDMARMVDIHEAIHTNDEYETRILTSWIMSREKPQYIK